MKNETKQTAVEWLFAELKNHLDMPSHHANEILEQVKEMEKQQIMEAWEDDRFPLDKEWVKQCAEKYYNETYGGNK